MRRENSFNAHKFVNYLYKIYIYVIIVDNDIKPVSYCELSCLFLLHKNNDMSDEYIKNICKNINISLIYDYLNYKNYCTMIDKNELLTFFKHCDVQLKKSKLFK